jgi:hypothetical protein
VTTSQIAEGLTQDVSYRLRFAPDGHSLEWLATDDQGDVVLSEESEVTPFMRLQHMLLAPFVPEQLL